MERQKGSGRASYIYGRRVVPVRRAPPFLTSGVCRSVHNTRIERLWLDWTQGVGLKWHDFFMSLEHNYDLKHDNPAHIWLLHYLFLDALNADAEDWAAAWNNHVMQIAGETNRSPVDMFTFGILRDGARGFTIDDARMAQQEADSAPMSQEEAATFGVDYEAHGDARLMAHLAENNQDEWEDNNDNPFVPDVAPEHRPHVVCEPPNSPLSAAQIAVLDARLRACVDLTSRDMEVRKLVWRQALRICGEMFA
ncbi:hypothetical protein C8R44DRAFT_616395 [Mycena epipterygia]|nr:hypothetical protein C8R44DRAFT_616395 [Mycena epipterygia]